VRTDARPIERHLLVQRPARRLHDAALDLVAQPVGIHDLAAVHRSNGTYEADAATVRIDRDFRGHGAIGGAVLIARESEAPAPPGRRLRIRPAEPFGRELNDGSGARILEMLEAKLHGVCARRLRELVHESFEREHIEVGAERP